MLTKLQTFSLTSSLCIKYIWPDIHPESWFILEFPQLELKQIPTLRSFGLTRTLICLQFLPVSLSKSKTHFSLQLLAVNKSHKAATSCQSWHSLLLLVPHPRRAHVYASAQLRSRMSETFSFAVCAVSFQSSKMRPGARRGPLLLSHSSSDYGTSQRSCHTGILWGPWVMNVLLKEVEVNNC